MAGWHSFWLGGLFRFLRCSVPREKSLAAVTLKAINLHDVFSVPGTGGGAQGLIGKVGGFCTGKCLAAMGAFLGQMRHFSKQVMAVLNGCKRPSENSITSEYNLFLHSHLVLMFWLSKNGILLPVEFLSSFISLN